MREGKGRNKPQTFTTRASEWKGRFAFEIRKQLDVPPPGAQPTSTKTIAAVAETSDTGRDGREVLRSGGGVRNNHARTEAGILERYLAEMARLHIY